MPNMSGAVRFNKIPALGFVPESSGTAPTAPVVGQLWIDTSVTPKLLKVWDGATWAISNMYFGTTAGTVAQGNDTRIVNAEQVGNKNAANGYAGLDAGSKIVIGQLPTGQTGTTVPLGNDARFTDQRVPTDGSVTGGTAGAGVKIATGTITDVNVAAANKDGVAGTPSLRTLGTGAAQAAAGNDARFTDARTPTAGSVVDASVAAGAAIAESKLALASDAAAGTASRRTLGTGANQAMPGNTRMDTIAVPTGAVNHNNQRITSLGAPLVATDAARLQDVQAAAAGIDNKPSVRIASTGNVAVATNGLAAIDGVTPVVGDRVLLKNQTTTTENGVYVAAAGAWARDTDTITANSFWFVEEGTANADTSWMVTTNGAITPGTTPLTIGQFGAATSYSGVANRITVTGGSIDIASNYAGQASITSVGTLSSGALGAGFTTITVAQGGTGATTAAGARTSLGVAQAGYAATLGAVTAGTPLVVTHNLGTQDVIAQVRDASTNEYIFLDVINASTNTVTITSGIAYAANALRIVVLPVA